MVKLKESNPPFKAAEPVEPAAPKVAAPFPAGFSDIAEAPKTGRVVKLWFGESPDDLKSVVLAKWRQTRKWDKGWKDTGFWAHPFNSLKLDVDRPLRAFMIVPQVTQEEIEISNQAVAHAQQRTALAQRKKLDEADAAEARRHEAAVMASS